ncbi:hypothetical protein IV203_033332 [Nitzschia inconspicua]|uniref:DUF6824 domain-containing protein n=1 Tax=Nitzschia inconspicua TaxID=303405 RepID=A0A9K3KM19_9STRA|nr:hypothetical protein IV203_033332 [Nitzschia inconspicua]
MILKEGLSVDDVLLGRGTGSNEHDGNIRFRAIVKQVLRQSLASAIKQNPSNIPSGTKSSMAATVLSIVHDRGGQFVRKASKVEILAFLGEKANSAVSYADEKMVSSSNWYVVVPRQVALEKAKQSFRHQKRVLHSEQERSSIVAKELVASRGHIAQVRSSSVVDNAGSSTWNDSCPFNLDASSVLKMVQLQAAAAAETKQQQFQSALSSQDLMKHTGCALDSRLANHFLPSLSTTRTDGSLALLKSLLSGSTASSSSVSSNPTVLGLNAPVSAVSSTLQDLASKLSTNSLLDDLLWQQQSQKDHVALSLLLAAPQQKVPPSNNAATSTVLHSAAVGNEFQHDLWMRRVGQQALLDRMHSPSCLSDAAAGHNKLLSEAIALAVAVQQKQ